MHVVHVLTARRSRWLLTAAALAATGAIAWRATHHARPPKPTPDAPIACAIPIDDPIVTPAPVEHFAVPPPGDPYPRPPTVAAPERPPVEAVLVARPDRLPDCGDMLIETTMVFHPLESTSRGDLRVLVPCAEMTRAVFGGPDAGTAGVLEAGHRYMLWLTLATDMNDGKNASLWRATRIDDRGR